MNFLLFFTSLCSIKYKTKQQLISISKFWNNLFSAFLDDEFKMPVKNIFNTNTKKFAQSLYVLIHCCLVFPSYFLCTMCKAGVRKQKYSLYGVGLCIQHLSLISRHMHFRAINYGQLQAFSTVPKVCIVTCIDMHTYVITAPR